MKSIEDFQGDQSYKEYLRVHFAAMAMQGLLANPELYKIVSGSGVDAIDIYTKASIEHADDLLSQLGL